MYSAQKKYTFIAALLMSFITGGALFGMEVKAANPAVFEELPTELNRSIVLKWLERTLGYNYISRTLSILEREPFIKNKSLIPTCNPDLVLIARHKDVLLYNIQTEQIEREFEAEQSIQQIAVNVDSTKVAGAQGKEIFLWDFSTEEKSVVFKADEILCSVALSPDGKYILAGGAQDVYLCDSSTKSLVKKIKVTTKNTKIYIVAFNRESNKILTYTCAGETIVWNLQGNKLTTCVKLKYNSLSAALFSPDERSIIVAGQGIILFDAHTGNIRLTNFDIGNILSLACSPDGNTLIAGSAGAPKVYVIDLKTAKVLTTLEHVEDIRSTSNFVRGILAVCFTSDGNNILSASGHGILCLHSRLKEEDNEWIHTRKETALELFLQLQGKPKQEELTSSIVPTANYHLELTSSIVPTTNYYQQLQNLAKDPAFLIFPIFAMILAYNM